MKDFDGTPILLLRPKEVRTLSEHLLPHRSKVFEKLMKFNSDPEVVKRLEENDDGSKIIGLCSLCGGMVSIAAKAMGINRCYANNKYYPTCESCGAVANEGQYLPVIQMKETDDKPRKVAGS